MEIGAVLAANKLLYLCSIWFVGGLGVYLVAQSADIYSHFYYIAREYVFVHSTMGRQKVINEIFVHDNILVAFIYISSAVFPDFGVF